MGDHLVWHTCLKLLSGHLSKYWANSLLLINFVCSSSSYKVVTHLSTDQAYDERRLVQNTNLVNNKLNNDE